ncbi:YjzC family protein [Virgibacillus kekensis]|uniref:YjzC family protein n=1 Tax=Virgibacillus kekensis TaxID=202261 RepID=A0ABV9DMB2_9BACI
MISRYLFFHEKILIGGGARWLTSSKQAKKHLRAVRIKIESLVSGGTNNDDTTIQIEKDEQFPPSPSENEAAYWVKV